MQNKRVSFIQNSLVAKKRGSLLKNSLRNSCKDIIRRLKKEGVVLIKKILSLEKEPLHYWGSFIQIIPAKISFEA